MEAVKSLRKSLSKVNLVTKDSTKEEHPSYRPIPVLSRKMSMEVCDNAMADPRTVESRGRSNNRSSENHIISQSNILGQVPEREQAPPRRSRHESHEGDMLTQQSSYEPPITRSTSRLSRNKSNATLRASAVKDTHIQRTLSRLSDSGVAPPVTTVRNASGSSSNSQNSDGEIRPATPYYSTRHGSSRRVNAAIHNSHPNDHSGGEKAALGHHSKHVHFKAPRDLETATNRQLCDPRVKLPPKNAIPMKGSLRRPSRGFPGDAMERRRH